MKDRPIIGIDPGTDKCGVAVVDANGTCLWRSVEPTTGIVERVAQLAEQYPSAVLVLGDGTGSDDFLARLVKGGITGRLGVPVLVDEHRSTDQARMRYLRDNRRGWRRLVPLGLQTPDRPVDDYVAEVLAKKYLASIGPVRSNRQP